MKDKPWDEIYYSQVEQCTTAGVTLSSHIIFTTQTLCISEQTGQFSGFPICATDQHGYQCLAVEMSHISDVTDRECAIVCFAMRLALSMGEFHLEAKDIHNRWLEVLCQEQVQYYVNSAKKAQRPFKQYKQRFSRCCDSEY